MIWAVASARSGAGTGGNHSPDRGRSCRSSSSPLRSTGSMLPRHSAKSVLVRSANIRLALPARNGEVGNYPCTVLADRFLDGGVSHFRVGILEQGTDLLVAQTGSGGVLDDAGGPDLE